MYNSESHLQTYYCNCEYLTKNPGRRMASLTRRDYIYAKKSYTGWSRASNASG